MESGWRENARPTNWRGSGVLLTCTRRAETSGNGNHLGIPCPGPSHRTHSELLAHRIIGPTGTCPGRYPRHPLSGWSPMSTPDGRLLAGRGRIPDFPGPSSPALAVCAVGTPAHRGKRSVSASLPAPSESTAHGGTCGASPRGRTLSLSGRGTTLDRRDWWLLHLSRGRSLGRSEESEEMALPAGGDRRGAVSPSGPGPTASTAPPGGRPRPRARRPPRGSRRSRTVW